MSSRTAENTPVSFSVLGNDEDLLADGSALRLISVDLSTVPGGTLQFRFGRYGHVRPRDRVRLTLQSARVRSFSFTYVVGRRSGVQPTRRASRSR